ncbi:MAG: glycosyltransferase [Lewinellaceae bacterium]|nr:glycosyltransferase [Lewinellaceae bacterium]
MPNPCPLVSISMVVYNSCEFVEKAIEGVLGQKIDFPIELVIGDDCSTDGTRMICERYEKQFPGIVRLLPEEPNMGIAANTFRTLGNCRGKYIAICDGDDCWVDPHKLARQVRFLEEHPRYGVVYTDVETVDETDNPVADAEQDQIRQDYSHGAVFIQLLGGNFINNSTALFRRDLILDQTAILGRTYHIPDFIRWLHIAARSRVHYFPYVSTQYRRHSRGLSLNTSAETVAGNREAVYRALHHILPAFDRHNNQPLTKTEHLIVFRRTMTTILFGRGTIREKWRLTYLLPRYFPGLLPAYRWFVAKYWTGKLVPKATLVLLFPTDLLPFTELI